MYLERIQALRAVLEEQQLDAILVTGAANIQYLSGFTGGADARLLVTLETGIIFTDGRYREQVLQECPAWELRVDAAAGMEPLTLAMRGLSRLGFESTDVSYQQYLELQAHLNVELVPVQGMIESLRMIKSHEELELLREAARRGDDALQALLPLIQPGISEKDLADHLIYLLRQKGCAKEAFDAIVVSGENAAFPHGQPGGKLLAPGDMVTLDFGGLVQGYVGDMTRTLVLAQPSPRFLEVYHAVRQAQQRASEAVRPGVSCREIDRIARETLAEYDLDRYFVHGTGHGIGLEIHEKPTLSTRSQDILKENMVITVEPGVYIPGWGGIRIEDSLIVTPNGSEIITHSLKDILII